MNSRFAVGEVYHCRYTPKHHAFRYPLLMMWVDLDEVPILSKHCFGFGERWFHPLRFQAADYLRIATEGDDERQSSSQKLPPHQQLKAAVIHQVSEHLDPSVDLAQVKVYLLGQLRYFGVYFSPLNLYYVSNGHNDWCCTLAEVSNIPWNERHCYVIPNDIQMPYFDHPKTFHVSPFHPMTQTYRWRLTREDMGCSVSLQNIEDHDTQTESRVFEASFRLSFKPFTFQTWFHHAWRFPMITLKIVFLIYWQALQLWWKKVPFWAHPQSTDKDNK